MVTQSTRYLVEATYSSGRKENVTSDATVTSSSPLTFSGTQIIANKVWGILGELSITASYQEFSDSQILEVTSDIVDNKYFLYVNEYFTDDEGISQQYSYTVNPGETSCTDDPSPSIRLGGYAMLADGSTMSWDSSYLDYSCTSISCDCGRDNLGRTPDTYHEIYILKYLGMEIARWTFRF